MRALPRALLVRRQTPTPNRRPAPTVEGSTPPKGTSGRGRRRRRGRRGSRLRRYHPVRFGGDHGVHARARGGGARRVRARRRLLCSTLRRDSSTPSCTTREGQARLEPRLPARASASSRRRRTTTTRWWWRRRTARAVAARLSTGHSLGGLSTNPSPSSRSPRSQRGAANGATKNGVTKNGATENGAASPSPRRWALPASLSVDDSSGSRGNPESSRVGRRRMARSAGSAGRVRIRRYGRRFRRRRDRGAAGVGPAAVACIQKVPESPERAVLAVARFAYPRIGTNGESQTGPESIDGETSGQASASPAPRARNTPNCSSWRASLQGRRRRRRTRARRR